MSKFFFLCPHCGHQVKAQDDWVGLEAQCPHCGHSIAITKPDGAPASAPAAVLPGAQEEKQCPFCGRMIKKGAVFCKYCKRDLSGVSGGTVQSEPEKTFPYICPDCETFAELPLSMEGREYECKACAESHIATPATGRKCPYCGAEIKIRAAVCKYCRKQVPPLTSGAAWKSFRPCGIGAKPTSRLGPYDQRMQIIGAVICIVSLFFALIFGGLAGYFKFKSRRISFDNVVRHASPRNRSDDFDIEKEKTRALINSLPESQRSAFYGSGGSSMDKMNLLTRILDSGNIDGAIKLLEEK